MTDVGLRGLGSDAWRSEGQELFVAKRTLGGMYRYLMVERLPDGGWDWTTWCGDYSGDCEYGTSSTVAAAMRAAERAAAPPRYDMHHLHLAVVHTM